MGRTLAELVAEFDVDRIERHSALLDLEKLSEFNRWRRSIGGRRAGTPLLGITPSNMPASRPPLAAFLSVCWGALVHWPSSLPAWLSHSFSFPPATPPPPYFLSPTGPTESTFRVFIILQGLTLLPYL